MIATKERVGNSTQRSLQRTGWLNSEGLSQIPSEGETLPQEIFRHARRLPSGECFLYCVKSYGENAYLYCDMRYKDDVAKVMEMNLGAKVYFSHERAEYAEELQFLHSNYCEWYVLSLDSNGTIAGVFDDSRLNPFGERCEENCAEAAPGFVWLRNAKLRSKVDIDDTLMPYGDVGNRFYVGQDTFFYTREYIDQYGRKNSSKEPEFSIFPLPQHKDDRVYMYCMSRGFFSHIGYLDSDGVAKKYSYFSNLPESLAKKWLKVCFSFDDNTNRSQMFAQHKEIAEKFAGWVYQQPSDFLIRRKSHTFTVADYLSNRKGETTFTVFNRRTRQHGTLIDDGMSLSIAVRSSGRMPYLADENLPTGRIVKFEQNPQGGLWTVPYEYGTERSDIVASAG